MSILTIDGSKHPDLFEKDNFTSRRTTGLDLYDPEALLTGAEIAAGLSYADARVWPSYGHYLDATEGLITVAEIPQVAPRQKKAAAIDTRIRLGRIN